eukprot:s7166_g2.t1
MEDRTALMEFVAVMSMVPPANAPTAGQIQEHMSTIFPARAATATPQAAVPTVTAPTIPAKFKAYPGAPPSAWAGQVQWQPPTPRPTAAGMDPTAVSGTTFLDTPNRQFFNLSAMEAESALPWTQAPRMVAQHSVDEAGVSRPASPSTRTGAAEQRATTQDTGATSPTSSFAPTEVVFEAASTILLGMDNVNNGDPQFRGNRPTRQIAEEARRATGYIPGPTAAGADGGYARLRRCRGPRRLRVQEPGRRRRSGRSGAASRPPVCRRSRPRHPTLGICRRAARPAWPTISRHMTAAAPRDRRSTVREGGSLSEPALPGADRGDREGDARRVPAA